MATVERESWNLVLYFLPFLLAVVMLRSCNSWTERHPKPRSKSATAMAMEKTNISCSFPWDRLPLDLQQAILGLLPTSALIRCTAASRSLRSVIRSPSFNYRNFYPQPQFLFFDKPTAITDAYDPLLDRWTSFPLPSYSERLYFCSQHFLLILTSHDSYLVYNLLSGQVVQIPPKAGKSLPNEFPFEKPVALIPDTPHHFKLVMAIFRDDDCLYSHVYESRTGEWTAKGTLPQKFSWLQHGLVRNGLVYCLGYNPNCLMAFDPIEGEWEWGFHDVELPDWECLHIEAFDGRLFNVAELSGRVGIWEMDWKRMKWAVHCFMPEEVFAEFSRGSMDCFQVVVLKGMFCFVAVRRKRHGGASVLMYDLPLRRWWWPSACERRAMELFNHGSVHAVEPCADLLKANRWLGGE